MGRLVGTSTQYAFLTGTYTNSYSYDANSNRTGFTAPDGSTNTYTYDTLNRLSTLANSWAGSFGFTYDALSRRTQMTRPNNVATNYGYDNQSRLLSMLHQLAGSTIDGATYTVDSAGNRTSKTDNRANVTSNYGYDAIYELLQTTQGGTTTESYTYDPVGNRLSSLGVSPYSYNTSNELTSTPSASYTYDNNGNTLTKTASGSTTNYTWDYENRLTQVTLPGSGGTVTFKYDPLGHRIQKAYTQGSTTTTANYIYDGDNSVQDIDQNGNLLARYTETQNIDEPLAESRSGVTSYYNADGLGSVTSLGSSTGALANTYTYDSLGRLTASSGSITNRFQYTAREFDSESGLYYYRARYIDPSTGRFASEDPKRFSGGYNFYAYVANKPTEFRDPKGLLPTKGSGLDHFNLTLGLARAAFGPKCEARAQAVAQADADQDALSGWFAHFEFLIGQGDGWRQGSIHFGGPVDQLLHDAFGSCSDYALGMALHGLQDDLSHSGPFASPFTHWWSSGLGWAVGLGSPADNPGLGLADAIASDTASILRQYKTACLKCCQ